LLRRGCKSRRASVASEERLKMTNAEILRELQKGRWRIYRVLDHPDITVAATLGAGSVAASDVQALGRKLLPK
jgi:hypothetical protein